MKEIFEKFDSRLVKSKTHVKKFAKANGYKYYSQLVYELYKFMTARSIQNKMISFGIENPPKVMTIRNLALRIGEEIAAVKPKNKKRLCTRCRKRVIPDNHRLFCNKCYNVNITTAIRNETEYYNVGC